MYRDDGQVTGLWPGHLTFWQPKPVRAGYGVGRLLPIHHS